MQYSDMDDVQIVRLSRAGDDAAMEYLLKKYRGMVKKETRKMYLIGADDEDLQQEGMIGLFKAIRDYDLEKPTDFALFAHICIARQLYSAVTASNRKKHTPLNSYISFYTPVEKEEKDVTLQEILQTQESNPEEKMIEKEQLSNLYQNIDTTLSAMEKKVLTLYLDGYSYDVIGETLGKKKKSIDNAIQRIRKKLSSL